MKLQGSMTALATPCRNGALDEKAYAALIEYQLANGTSALVPMGTTGEAATMSAEERRRAIELCVEVKLLFIKEFNQKLTILNISNAQITELTNKDMSFELGFTKNNMKLPFKAQGRTVVLKNDVTFRMNLTVSNTKTIQRKIDELNLEIDNQIASSIL